jgi:DNA-binding NarL/FixJ family response regulator
MSVCTRTSLLRKITSRRRRTERDRGVAWTFVSIDSGRANSTITALALMGGSPLTPREVEVLRYVARGETDRSIAKRLFLSRRTVSNHVSNAIAKLDVSTRREAVIAAVRLGLL